MQANLVSFIQVLRTHDVRVSPAETLDAMDVAKALGYADRERLRDGLAMALAKTPEEEAVFLQCFDRFFHHKLADFSLESSEAEAEAAGQDADTGAEPPAGQPTAGPAGGAASLAAAAEQDQALQSLLSTPLMQSLLDNDRNELAMAMNRAAERVGLRQIQMFTQKGQFTRRILDELGEQHIRDLSLIHISEPTRHICLSRMPSSA